MDGEGPQYLPRMSLAGTPLPFSGGVRIGDILYLSGQMGFRADGTLVEGMQGQTRQALDNVGAILASAGLGFSDVFHCTVMLADTSLWAAFNQIYLEYFTEPLPTRSAFGVAALALGGLVELECQAYAGGK